ncbi:MAG: tetratricopeptide repeat protein [Isosphaeraceae bacterium]
MNPPDWRDMALEAGVLREDVSDGSRIVLWLPGEQDGAFQNWERVGTAARAEVNAEQGLCSIAATSVPARQRVKGTLGKLLGRLRAAKTSRSLLLPGGDLAEPCGERNTDLLLVWAEDQNEPLDKGRIQSRWPEAQRFRKLGHNLFLVGLPVQQKPAAPVPPVTPPPPDVSPRQHAEQLLAAARQEGDRRKEVSALTDLAIIILTEGDPRGAIALFEQALTLSRPLGDPARECDIMGNLGMALLHAQQPARARPMFERGLAHARSTGDPMAEKVALERLGLASSSVGDSQAALSFYEQALTLARQVGDKQQEANLLWFQGIQLAELGHRDAAIAKAQDSIALFTKLGKPQASWYGAYLQKYRMGLFDTWPTPATAGVAAGPQAYLGGALVAGVMAGPQAGESATPKSTTGPGLLRMALSATKAMAQFAGSGFKTTPLEVQRQRLQVCSTCEYHTGIRCKVCGCFTTAKSKLLQESCPIGKWPA